MLVLKVGVRVSRKIGLSNASVRVLKVGVRVSKDGVRVSKVGVEVSEVRIARGSAQSYC